MRSTQSFGCLISGFTALKGVCGWPIDRLETSKRDCEVVSYKTFSSRGKNFGHFVKSVAKTCCHFIEINSLMERLG